MINQPRYWNAIERAVDQWFIVATVRTAYLYFVPNGQDFGAFGEDGPPNPKQRGWQIVTAEAMPSNTDRAGIRQWIDKRTRGLEFYGTK